MLKLCLLLVAAHNTAINDWKHTIRALFRNIDLWKVGSGSPHGQKTVIPVTFVLASRLDSTDPHTKKSIWSE